MNRNEEYKQLMQDLDVPVSALEYTLARAKAKNRRRKWFFRSTGVLAAVFACFVILVNFYSPVAYACSRVPVLRELAEAVTFSRSLTDAVKNEYVQPIDLNQTDNEVTVKIEYLIVDQKQVNVFFHLESDVYEHMNVRPDVYQSNGEAQASCSYSSNGYDVPTGQLQSITIDFFENDVPEQLLLKLDIADHKDFQMTEPLKEVSLDDNDYESDYDYKSDYVAHFDFLLTFDPKFTALKRDIKINQIVMLGDQQIKLINMEVYPTHLRLNVEDVLSNTAWLRRLDFCVETDVGVEFDTITNGISATGSIDSPMMASFRADSPYFYKADHFKIVISGAEWLNKDMQRIHLDLAKGKADQMPENAEIYAITRKNNGWSITVRAKERSNNAEDSSYFHQVFMSTYYDPDGNKGEINSWSTTGSQSESEEDEKYFYCEFPLTNYDYDEVWLMPAYSHEWFTTEPIELTVQ